MPQSIYNIYIILYVYTVFFRKNVKNLEKNNVYKCPWAIALVEASESSPEFFVVVVVVAAAVMNHLQFSTNQCEMTIHSHPMHPKNILSRLHHERYAPHVQRHDDYYYCYYCYYNVYYPPAVLFPPTQHYHKQHHDKRIWKRISPLSPESTHDPP